MVDIWGRNNLNTLSSNVKYLFLDGSKNMLGSLNVGSHRVVDISDPDVSNGCSTKGYIDSRLLSKVNKSGDYMTLWLNMNNNFITNIKDPVNNQDIATKHYAYKNQVGIIPVLSSNTNNRNGMIVTASSEYNANYQGWNIFSNQLINGVSNQHDWAATSTTNEWVQIYMPFGIKIYKFQICGRIDANQQFKNWAMQASNDGINYATLYSTTVKLQQVVQEFILSPTPSISYNYFRFYGFTANGGPKPGLSSLELF